MNSQATDLQDAQDLTCNWIARPSFWAHPSQDGHLCHATRPDQYRNETLRRCGRAAVSRIRPYGPFHDPQTPERR
jgi:hypothetical protein